MKLMLKKKKIKILTKKNHLWKYEFFVIDDVFSVP